MVKRILSYIGDPKNIRTLKIFFYITLVVIVIADILVPREHAAFIWDSIPGWSAVYGFISCMLIILIYKFLGHQCHLMKKEDYYE